MARRSSRLEKDRLEAALEELCDDQPDEAVRVVGKMIHGHEKAAGVDPNFAGLLHDKLAEKVDGPEPSGLRAPCVTGVLSAEELAALDDDDEADDSAKVVIDTKSHGVIDQVDSKLVTELNKKLCEEAAHTHEKPSEGFSADLSAALEKKLGGQDKVEPSSHGTIDAINNDLIAAVERKLGHQTTSGDLEQDETVNVSGLRAPQCTQKLSAEMIAALDDEDDEETKPECATHGAIDNINDSLVLELQRKLANAGEETEESCTAAELSAPEPVGFRAPHNTMKLDPDMIKALDDDEDELHHSHGAIDGIDSKLVAELQQKLENDPDDEDHVDTKPLRGCRAPQPTQKLTQDMLAGLALDDDDVEELTVAPPPTMTGASITEAAAKLAQSQETDGKRLSGQFDPSFAAELHHKLADKKEDHGGLRAPEPTKLLSSDMLANLDDEEEEQTGHVLNDACEALQALPARSISDSSLSVQGQQSEDLAARPKKPKRTISFRNSCGTDQEFAANLAKKLGEGMPNISETDDGIVQSGTRAPHTTTNLTDATLDEVWNGDEEEVERKFEGGRIAPQCTQVLSAELLAEVDDDDDTDPVMVMESGMKAPQCTAVLSIDQLAGLDEDNEQQPQQQPEPLTNVAPSTAETDFAAKVIQNMRDLPNGNAKPVSSSCKLRLAWLSDDEVQKENDSLRREIASLRAQIEMHRKEACLARK